MRRDALAISTRTRLFPFVLGCALACCGAAFAADAPSIVEPIQPLDVRPTIAAEAMLPAEPAGCADAADPAVNASLLPSDSQETAGGSGSKCCDPSREPGVGGNPLCFEGHTCCADGQWRCNNADATPSCPAGQVCSSSCGLSGATCNTNADCCSGTCKGNHRCK